MSVIQIDFIPLHRAVQDIPISEKEETEKTRDQDATAQLNSKAAPIPLCLRPSTSTSSYIWVLDWPGLSTDKRTHKYHHSLKSSRKDTFFVILF